MNATLAHIIKLCLGHFATPELPLPAQPTTRKERRAAQRKTGKQ